MTTDPQGTAPARTPWGLRAFALLRALALAPLLALGPALAWAQISLQSVSSSVQGGVEVVRIEFSQPLASPPAGFAVQTPPRIALDFTGVSNALSSGLVEVAPLPPSAASAPAAASILTLACSAVVLPGRALLLKRQSERIGSKAAQSAQETTQAWFRLQRERALRAHEA